MMNLLRRTPRQEAITSPDQPISQADYDELKTQLEQSNGSNRELREKITTLEQKIKELEEELNQPLFPLK